MNISHARSKCLKFILIVHSNRFGLFDDGIDIWPWPLFSDWMKSALGLLHNVQLSYFPVAIIENSYKSLLPPGNQFNSDSELRCQPFFVLWKVHREGELKERKENLFDTRSNSMYVTSFQRFLIGIHINSKMMPPPETVRCRSH